MSDADPHTETHPETAAATAGVRVVEALERLGVTVAFGLPGVHNLPIWKALAQSSIRLVGVRHEQTAVYAADGYARATGRLGVAVVTTGPGAANTLGATGEAMAAGSPVLVIATDIPAAIRRPGTYRGTLHETRDQTAMFAPVTKSATLVATAAETGDAVIAGAQAALAAPSGPVYVGVPTDLLRRPAPEIPAQLPPPRPPAFDGTGLDEAVALIARARRPLIWAGGGALRADAGDAVSALAHKLCAPIITTYMSRGLLAPDDPFNVAGPAHAPEVGALWDEADLVVGIGTDFDGMMTQNWLMPQPPKLVCVNVDPVDATKNYAADVTLVGDAREVTLALVAGVRARDGAEATLARLEQVRAGVAAAVLSDDADAAGFIAVMDRALGADAVVVADMCIPGYWLAGYRRVPRPRAFAYPMGWGTLGFAFPASLGAALADIGPTVCVCGDGGFLFACGELATVAEAQLPLTVVLVDDGGYGMLRFDQELAGDEPFGVDLVGPDFAALARSFGIGASTVRGFGAEFEDTLRHSVTTPAPSVIVVKARLKPPPTTSPRWYRRAHG
ncbi:MAG TPA: thiamine pyrophosphate-binding protein [Solirubrobacteraceae bacterium]|nr:thiamine pyrophosphate-binding protein [Solirubrobacteraceae bacterium]